MFLTSVADRSFTDRVVDSAERAEIDPLGVVHVPRDVAGVAEELQAVAVGGEVEVLRDRGAVEDQRVVAGLALWTLWDEEESAVWLPLGTAVGLGLVMHRRLLQVEIPAFLHGLATLSRRRERFDL